MKLTVRIVVLWLSVTVFVFSFVSCSKDRNDDFSDSSENANITNQVSADDTDVTSEGSSDNTGTSTQGSSYDTDTTIKVTESSSQKGNKGTDDPQNTEDGANDEDKNYIFEVVYPSVSVSSLKFKLTDDDLIEYKNKLIATKRLFHKNEKGSEDEFKNALYELLSLKAEMLTQSGIAYVRYLYDTSDPVAWDNYLYAYDLHDEARSLFWAFYAEAKNEENNLTKVFKEVVKKEYKDGLVSVTPDSHSYSYEMEVLEGEYNSLQSSNASDEKLFETYKKYMIAAAGFAKSSSSDNYFEYANKHLLYRKDTPAQRAVLREYTKQYLVPLYKELSAKSKSYDSQLSLVEYTLSNKYLYGSYDSFQEDYLFSYFSSLQESSGKSMKDAFEQDRVLIGDRDGSYDSAMVYMVGNTPICYFHESKTTLDTMSHELGHYYTHIVEDASQYSYDLKETHSTANTMLLYSYLSDKIDSKAFTSAEVYMVSNWVYQTISSVIKDEFDEIIYTRDPSSLKLEDFEEIMSDLIDEYQVRDMSNSLVDQLMTYWRRNGIIYPMKNYSYATAMITSLQIYVKSKDDYAAASEIYRKIVEEPQHNGDFLLTIEKAGLTTPYDEQTYMGLERLKDLY